MNIAEAIEMMTSAAAQLDLTNKAMAEARDVIRMSRITIEEDNKTISRLRTALQEILEEAGAREDVDDGPDGNQVPNAWMRIANICREVLE